MFYQTIALFRYQLRGLINRKILIFLLGIYLLAFMGGQFIAELAIINSQTIAAAAMADFIRYSLAMMLVISICHQVSQDYELNQFDRILAMPLTRLQYVLAQILVMAMFSFLLTLPILLLFFLFNDFSLSLYWALSVFLELLLLGHFALLAALSLEKLPIAVIFTFAIYLLAKMAPLIVVIFAQSGEYYVDEEGFALGNLIFTVIHFVLPDASAFAQNNMLFSPVGLLATLSSQVLSALVYSAFILFIILLDFYRKEFNQT